MNDPKTAIDAALQTENEIEGITVYPVTLARYALLELLESPFVTAGKDMKVSELIPSLFVICSSRDVLKKYNSKNIDLLMEAASVWADYIDTAKLGIIMNAVVQKINDMMAVAPQAPSDESAKKKE